MTSLQRLARSAVLSTTLIVVAAGVAGPARVRNAAPPERAATPTIGAVSAQLGVKVTNLASEDFALGVNFTGVLEDPAKLAAFGIKDMHVGARVTASRMAPDRVIVEADEMEPIPARSSVRLRLGADGTLLVPPKA